MPRQDGAGGPNGAAPGTPAGATQAGASATGGAPSGGGPSGGAAVGDAPVGSPTGAPDGVVRGVPAALRGTHYKWLALSNTTLGMLAATVNASIVIISLPAIFRGIKLNQ